ncbi:MAG TPA: hypothetical protein DDZ80_18045 [Cyanobacteria bacterium UBA8803]|nr:hypothetical protein [Cyanobacteria bacterium UBA9273]HBL60288.1 hypothetical protein [Cyanobacteria bacterium UBA8803]
MFRLFKRLFQDDKKLAAQQARIEQLEFQVSQLQADKTIELQQSRIDQLEHQLNNLKVNQKDEAQQTRIDELEADMSTKLGLLEQQNSVIKELTKRLEMLESQQSEIQTSTKPAVMDVPLEGMERLTQLEQHLVSIQPSSESEFISVTSIDKVTDVSPDRVYFEALQEMAERYAMPLCYPDSTFRGDKPLSRQEFVQHLVALTQQIQRMILASSMGG